MPKPGGFELGCMAASAHAATVVTTEIARMTTSTEEDNSASDTVISRF